MKGSCCCNSLGASRVLRETATGVPLGASIAPNVFDSPEAQCVAQRAASRHFRGTLGLCDFTAGWQERRDVSVSMYTLFHTT